MKTRRTFAYFAVKNALVWLAMTVILVVVPDTLNRWMPLEIARVVGWAVACAVWVVVVEQEWKARYGPFARFFGQILLWVSSALLAILISDMFRG